MDAFRKGLVVLRPVCPAVCLLPFIPVAVEQHEGGPAYAHNFAFKLNLFIGDHGGSYTIISGVS